MNRALLGAVGLGLAISLAACGGSNQAAAPPPTPPPEPPLPTPAFVLPAQQQQSGYQQYIAWRDGILQVVSKIKEVRHSILAMAENADRVKLTGDTTLMQSHLQDARDAINLAKDNYNRLNPTRSYRYIHWMIGQGLDSYAQGIDQLSTGLANEDISEVKDGANDLLQGTKDLTAVKALDSEQQWLLWLSRKGEERHSDENST